MCSTIDFRRRYPKHEPLTDIVGNWERVLAEGRLHDVPDPLIEKHHTVHKLPDKDNTESWKAGYVPNRVNRPLRMPDRSNLEQWKKGVPPNSLRQV